MVLWRPIRPSRTNTPQKDGLFVIGDWNAKVGSQERPGVTGKFGLGVQNEAGQRLTEFCQEYQTQIDYILCSQRWRSCIQPAKTRLIADCSSDHDLLVAKFRLKLKKEGETIRPFRYDLNQIPYDYTVEVTNRFKGLDLIECLKDYVQRFVTLYRR